MHRPRAQSERVTHRARARATDTDSDTDTETDIARRRQELRFTIPYDDCPVFSVKEGSDGKYYPSHPLLHGPYNTLEDFYGAASEVLGSRPKLLTPDIHHGHSAAPPLRGDGHSAPGLLQLRMKQRLEKRMVDVAESASALTLKDPESHNTIDNTLPPAQHYPSTSGPTIWVRRPPDWYLMFCIRMDRNQSFHVYPDLGGPFQSLHEAEDAIDRYVNGLPRPARSNRRDITSTVSQIRHFLFYPDGTPKMGPNSPGKKNPNYQERRLVQVILEQYNDDHNLFGDRAHKLNGDVKFHWFDENDRCYYHFNFMTKRDTGAADNLFFAELSQHERVGDSVVSCCCMIKHNDNGSCYGCIRERSPVMKHPKNTDAYTGGHIDYDYLTYGGDPCSDSDDDEDTQVAKLWMKLEGRDAPPGIMDKIITWNQATSVEL